MQLGLGVAAIVVGGVVAYALARVAVDKLAAGISSAAGKAADAVNPLNPNNAFSQAAGAASTAAGGSGSIGSDAYDLVQSARRFFGLPADPVLTTPTAPQPSKMTAGLMATLGVGDKLTRNDQKWMTGQLYGADVQTADIEDAEQGQFFRGASSSQAAADRLLYAVKP